MAGFPRPPAGDPVDDNGAAGGLRRKLGIKFREPKSAKLRVARNDDGSGSGDVGKRQLDVIIISREAIQ